MGKTNIFFHDFVFNLWHLQNCLSYEYDRSTVGSFQWLKFQTLVHSLPVFLNLLRLCHLIFLTLLYAIGETQAIFATSNCTVKASSPRILSCLLLNIWYSQLILLFLFFFFCFFWHNHLKLVHLSHFKVEQYYWS